MNNHCVKFILIQTSCFFLSRRAGVAGLQGLQVTRVAESGAWDRKGENAKEH